MTNLKPVPVYTLYPDELENLGYDISKMTQDEFAFIAHRLERTLDDGPILEMLDDIARICGVPEA